VTISTTIGIVLGLLAGYFGGWVDIAISRLLEFISTFPLLIILLVLMGILLQSEDLIPLPQSLVDVTAWITAIPKNEAKKVTLVILVLALLNWITTARMMRGMVLSVREQQYIESARALGGSNLRIIRKHVFPNAFPPIIVDFTLQLNNILILEAALSFLGFGIQDPTPTWGNMLAFAQSYMFEHPWVPMVPGLPILLTSLAINYIGDGLRDALDPRLRL
jgi:peptide/nickel transport system permease protein